MKQTLILSLGWIFYLISSVYMVSRLPVGDTAKGCVFFGCFGLGWALYLYIAHKLFPPEIPTIVIISKMLRGKIE